MLRKLNISMVIAAFSLAGCLGGGGGSGTGSGDGTGSGSGVTTPGDSLGLAGGGSTSGGMGNTFDHDNDGLDPFGVLQRIQEQGPPEISTKMHSCQKMKYMTVGNVLKQLGVNLAATGATSAAVIYKNGPQALGAPNYGARVAEAIELTTSGATKLFDIFVQAAPEIIAAMPTAAACKVGATATNMFDAAGACTKEGIACLQGAPATQAQVDLCNNAVTSASTAAIGKTIAVATILAAAGTCE
ncbi:MAG: hypothetical protein JWN44_478 [Myxococcales bacterium]|nr:hypothetical protein [Myxococcales bacterium]